MPQEFRSVDAFKNTESFFLHMHVKKKGRKPVASNVHLSLQR